MAVAANLKSRNSKRSVLKELHASGVTKNVTAPPYPVRSYAPSQLLQRNNLMENYNITYALGPLEPCPPPAQYGVVHYATASHGR
ncbi:hypothetical protein TNCV_4132911 [Trichonephila clavipes]|nr:hypothetical protein TNCV_4132911 [Trichonephila clavipes]